MDQEAEKAGSERDIFMEFVAVAALPVVLGSVESRRPPEPDILCELANEGRVAFELVQLVDQDLARTLARGESSGLWIGDPTLDMVRTKLIRKSYETQYPMELLAFGDDLLLPRDVWLPTFEQRLKNLLDESRFRRVWVVNLSRRVASRAVWLVHPPR
jgi:hypothetical protein